MKPIVASIIALVFLIIEQILRASIVMNMFLLPFAITDTEGYQMLLLIFIALLEGIEVSVFSLHNHRERIQSALSDFYSKLDITEDKETIERVAEDTKKPIVVHYSPTLRQINRSVIIITNSTQLILVSVVEPSSDIIGITKYWLMTECCISILFGFMVILALFSDEYSKSVGMYLASFGGIDTSNLQCTFKNSNWYFEPRNDEEQHFQYKKTVVYLVILVVCIAISISVIAAMTPMYIDVHKNTRDLFHGLNFESSDEQPSTHEL